MLVYSSGKLLFVFYYTIAIQSISTKETCYSLLFDITEKILSLAWDFGLPVSAKCIQAPKLKSLSLEATLGHTHFIWILALGTLS